MRLLLSLLLFSNLLNGQSPSSQEFKIFGVSDENEDKEIWIMNPIASLENAAYFELISDSEKVKVEHGKFLFSGKIKYPCAVRFMSFSEEERRGYMSDLYFVEPGVNDVILYDLQRSKNLNIKNASYSNKEYAKIKELLSTISDSARAEKLMFFQDYVKINPKSYVALWLLILEYTKTEYSKDFLIASSYFSNEIKNTNAYIQFYKKLIIDSTLAVNAEFPFSKYSFGDTIKNITQQSGLTLVDYWASYCKPCIAQFPELLKLLKDYKSEGFNIIGISIDKKENLIRMENILKRESIVWSNLLDDNGLQSLNLNISAIPRNFLLDHNGKILAKNIEVDALKKYLHNKFKSSHKLTSN